MLESQASQRFHQRIIPWRPSSRMQQDKAKTRTLPKESLLSPKSLPLATNSLPRMLQSSTLAVLLC